MTLGQTQRIFTSLIPKLIAYAYASGYELTLGDAFRDPRLHGEAGIKKGYGHANSNHKRRLALDLNLFKNGVFLQSTEDHRALGEFWESLHPSCRWGGRFNDGNHYSMEWQGQA